MGIDDRTQIYTDVQLVISDIIKAPKTKKLARGDVVSLLVLGGELELSPGRTVKHVVEGLGKSLQIGSRYIYFLQYHALADAFTPIKVWEIREGQAVAVWVDDLRRASAHQSEIYGQPEIVLLNRLRYEASK